MNVDPVDDCTFWYVNQYVPVTSATGWRLRIGSFKFPGCVAGPSGTLQGQVTVCEGGVPIVGASVSAGLFGATTDATGHYSFTLPSGDHTVTITALGYTSGGGPVTITDGGTTVLDACLTAVPSLTGAGATLVGEGCAPGNGRIDPGETVTVNFCVRNVGAANTTNLIGDLNESGGVGQARDPAMFGVVVAGGPDVCADVTFTADEALVCGDEVTASLDLEDAAADLGGLEYLFSTGGQFFSEGFDGVVAPAFPAGWTPSGFGNPWITTTTTADSPPNAAFTDDPAAVTDKRLDSPLIALPIDAEELRFRNFHNLEASSTVGYDGGVLEISISGGAFQDILAAGGNFVTGGYNRTISSSFGSPIAGRQAWSGNSLGYFDTVVGLPLAALGQNVVFRWRMASDSSAAVEGWRVDGVSVGGRPLCCTPIPEGLAVDAPNALAALSASPNDVWEPGETVVVEPSYFNGDSAALALSGTASNLTGPAGATYTLADAAAGYGSIASNAKASCRGTADCYQVSVDDPGVRPALHWDASFDETSLERSGEDLDTPHRFELRRRARRPSLLFLRRDDLSQRHHGRLRREQLLSRRPGASQAHGGLPPEGAVRRGVRAASGRGHLRGRPSGGSVRGLDRGPVQPPYHGGLLRFAAQFLSGQHGAARADGGVPPEDARGRHVHAALVRQRLRRRALPQHVRGLDRGARQARASREVAAAGISARRLPTHAARSPSF